VGGSENGFDFSEGSTGEYTEVASAKRAVRGVLIVVESSELEREGALIVTEGFAFSSVGISSNPVYKRLEARDILIKKWEWEIYSGPAQVFGIQGKKTEKSEW
jgi:hypothetical protein